MIAIEGPLDKWTLKKYEEDITKTIRESSRHDDEELEACWKTIRAGVLQVWAISRDMEIVALMVVSFVRPPKIGGTAVGKGLLVYAFRATVVVKEDEWTEGISKVEELASRAGCDSIVANSTNPVVQMVLAKRGWEETRTYAHTINKHKAIEGPAIDIPQ